MIGESRRLHGIEAPDLPTHDPHDPVESAIIDRLSKNWAQRASVKRPEPDLPTLFERHKPDFPEGMIPFHGDRRYLSLPEPVKVRLRAWGWIAFNKNVIDIERDVVNPGFELLAQDVLGTGLGQSVVIALNQAMVDEQYHTLMHLNSSRITRAARGITQPDQVLPAGLKVHTQREALGEAQSARDRALTSFAFATVAEISINSYLDLIADDNTVQPVNQATARMHSRDEYCHSSIADELAQMVYTELDERDRRHVLANFGRAMDAFAGTDYSTWARIMEIESVPSGPEMVQDLRAADPVRRQLHNFAGLRRLCESLGVLDRVSFDWSLVPGTGR